MTQKPVATGKASVRVCYDGKAPHFLDQVDTACLKQSEREAFRLTGFLSGATGNLDRVAPVLALPGRLVEQTASIPLPGSDIRVIIPSTPALMHKRNFGHAMPEDQRRRVAWALSKRHGEAKED